MRKTFLSALIASALGVAGTAQAGLTFDLNGAAGSGVISADAFDWTQTSFLAIGGNSAISNFANGACATASCSFDVMTHALLTSYTETGTGLSKSALGFGQITMVARYTEVVTGFIPGSSSDPIATFKSTGEGWVEFYYNGTQVANALTGSGFDTGRLIGRLTGISANKTGSFFVDPTIVALDGSGDGNDYDGQLTVSGSGSQQALDAGTTSKDLDPTFFLTLLTGFKINYENISIGLPYQSVNPSDCFNVNATRGSVAVGTPGLASTCDAAHVDGLYSVQGNAAGYTPNVGPVNGLDLGSPDFVAQTDYNSSVTGVPEPGTLALAGLALGSLGFAASRRRRG